MGYLISAAVMADGFVAKAVIAEVTWRRMSFMRFSRNSVRTRNAGLALHLLRENASRYRFRSGRRPGAVESLCSLCGHRRRGDPAGPCLRQCAPSDRAFSLGRRAAAKDCRGCTGHLWRGFFILRHEITFRTWRDRHHPLTTASATGAAHTAPSQRSHLMQRLAAHLARD